jgi:CMP/dCMP kinase
LEAIVISGMPAVGKTTVSKVVANELKLPLIGGGDVLKEMAAEQGYTPGGEDWWDKGEGMKFLQERKRTSGFDEEVDLRLLKKAKAGNVVITSYPLPWLKSEGLKVWLAGSVERRAERMSKRDGIPVSRCRRILSVRDVENYKLYKKIYEIEFGRDLRPFDLVVETDTLDEKTVAAIILRYVRGRSG